MAGLVVPRVIFDGGNLRGGDQTLAAALDAASVRRLGYRGRQICIIGRCRSRTCARSSTLHSYSTASSSFRSLASSLSREACRTARIHRRCAGRPAEWEPLKPKLVVEVEYDHLIGNRFRHGTRLLRWRPDKTPRQCTFDQLPRRSDPVLRLG
jgi:hypothetical protein